MGRLAPATASFRTADLHFACLRGHLAYRPLAMLDFQIFDPGRAVRNQLEPAQDLHVQLPMHHPCLIFHSGIIVRAETGMLRTRESRHQLFIIFSVA